MLAAIKVLDQLRGVLQNHVVQLVGRLINNAVVERIWHIQDIQGQILAWMSLKSLSNPLRCPIFVRQRCDKFSPRWISLFL